MKRRIESLIFALLVFAALIPNLGPPNAFAQEPTGARLEPIVGGEGLGRALGLADSNDGSGRLFVALQSGEIRIIENGALVPAPFLDISDRIDCCESERGLVGLAFHPRYQENGFFYVVYVNQRSRTVVSRFSVSGDPSRADPASEEEIIRWRQPDLPHNGGAIQFGPDGLLYLGSGDGGERGNAQDLGNLLGAILRIDVDSAFPYAIPGDNPFVEDPGARDEIWVYGLRNPWRFALDSVTGDLFIGDVGANRWEEISYLAGGSPAGANFGWPIEEGPLCLQRDEECADPTLVAPIIAYPHAESAPCNSVTGGYVYRGADVPTLPGFYVFGDFCRGSIWGARRNEAGNWVVNRLLETDRLISSFGEDSSGDLYVVTFRDGIFRLVGQHLFASDFESGDTLDWTQRRGAVSVRNPGLRRSDGALEVGAGAGKSFVRSKDPSGETTFKASFDLDVNDVNLANASAEIFRLAAGANRGHVRLVLEQEENRYWIDLRVRDNSGGFRSLGRTRVPRARRVRLELDWTAGTDADTSDGMVTLSKNGKPRIAATDLDNSRRKVSKATLGFPAGSTGSGSILFDNYASTP